MWMIVVVGYLGVANVVLIGIVFSLNRYIDKLENIQKEKNNGYRAEV